MRLSVACSQMVWIYRLFSIMISVIFSAGCIRHKKEEFYVSKYRKYEPFFSF